MLYIRLKKLASALIVALVLTSAGLKAEEACRLKVSIGNASDLDFHPTRLIYKNIGNVARNTYLSLFELGIDGDAIPVFAKSWQVDTENKRVRIQLDTSCRWSNGEPITAEQMADGIRMLHHVGRKSIALGHIRGSEEVISGKRPVADLGVKALSQDELEIAYDTNFDLLRYYLTRVNLTPLYQKLEDIDYNNLPKALPSVSSGAYVVDVQNDSKIALKRNPHFCYGKAGDIDEVDFFHSLPARSEIGAFEQGVIEILPESHVKSYYSLKKRVEKDDSIKITTANNVNVSVYLAVNLNTKALTHKSVQEAIKLVIDHEILTSNAIFGSGFSLLDGYTSSYKGYSSTKVLRDAEGSYSKRQAKAKKLMESLGYHKGNRLKLLLPNTENDARNAAVFALAGMLKKIHIDPEIQSYQTVQKYYGALKEGQYDLAFFILVDAFPDPSQSLQILLSFSTAPAHVENPIKEKLEASFKVSNQQERFSMLNEVERSLQRLGNILPLYTQGSVFIRKKHIGLNKLHFNYVRGYSNSNCH